MAKKAHIVVGLSYGDEGKGLVTDYYCSKFRKAIVVRFNGGQQAGHTVCLKNGQRHVFSNFGSGTLRGVPTYWSKYCTFSPGFFLDELKLLKTLPQFYLDNSCPITTHYDILYNRIIETFRGDKRHGSCGLGFGATIDRHRVLPVKMIASDLLTPEICMEKLSRIRRYYKRKIQKETNFLFSAFNHDEEDETFLSILCQIHDLVKKGVIVFVTENDIFNFKSNWETFIFEGSQGILLDVDFGEKPFVTKSNTTSRNAIEIIKRNFGKSDIIVEISYVTRAYHTRHGAGPFKTAKPPMKLKNNSNETNMPNEFQGCMRIGYLDFDLLDSSIRFDQQFSQEYSSNLFITCLDQIEANSFPVLIDGEKKYISYEMLQIFLKQTFSSIRYSFSRFSENIQ